MTWLILGVLLWAFAHLFKRILPGPRARMGDAGKGLVAILSLGAVVLMVIGYRAAEPAPLWFLGAWAIHLNNLLMVVAIALVIAANSKSRLRHLLRHPMLTGVLVWAVAHLLVNGDLPSLVLFGGIGLWAVASMALINRAEPEAARYSEGTAAGDIRLGVITIVATAVIVGIHTWLGVVPFAT